ncbi:MAG: class I SAM-dependent RNA methyltransferase [Deltaproteobacteria bacterium]|nr:class I SAM-dependent RNA methyltransferase [Deltaproteobacteria bacterium]
MGRPRKLKPGALVEVEIESLDSNVVGHGKTATGESVEVIGALPGESVTARIEHVTGSGRTFARLDSVLRPSNERRPSPCPHFQGDPRAPKLACGGCDFLHVDRDFELRVKKAKIEAALGVAVEPPLGRRPELGYRALAKLVADGTTLGSYAPWTHSVASMDGCPVHAPIVEQLAARARTSLGHIECPDLRFVLIRAALATSRVVVTLVVRSLSAKGSRALAVALGELPEVARVILLENDRADDVIVGDGPMELVVDRGPVFDRIGPVELELAGPAFAQVNPSAAAELYERVATALLGRSPIADLYAGSGGIGLTLAHKGATVFEVEANVAAARAIARSAEAMGLSELVRVLAARVEDALSDLPKLEAIVINPPRKGASLEVLREVMKRAPVRLVYVSCNPDSLARDVARMRAECEFEVGSATPVDLFPKTRHVETVLVADIHERSSS